MQEKAKAAPWTSSCQGWPKLSDYVIFTYEYIITDGLAMWYNFITY